jgi:hypothetical protein
MRVRSKKSAKEAHNQWCVILNPITSELSKTETVEKIVEAFPLSIDEASQLVERTPIILLENLNYDTAKKIKSIFSAVNADILLTEDMYLKRKCYRTVWSQDPLHKINLMNLSLEASSTVASLSAPVAKKEKLTKESAIQGIRSESVSSVSTLQPPASFAERSRASFEDKEERENEEALQEISTLKREIFELRRQLNLKEQSNNEFEYLSVELEKAKEALLEKDLTSEKLTKALQEERKTSALLKNKVDEMAQASEALRPDLTVHAEALDKIKLYNERLKGLLKDLQHDNEELRKIQRSYSELQSKYENL